MPDNLRSPQFAPETPTEVTVTHMPIPGDGLGGGGQGGHTTEVVSRDQPFLMDGDMLRVENHSKQPIELAWNRKRWVVAVGGQQFVLFEAIVNVLGDPRSTYEQNQHYDDGNGNRGMIQDRYSELTRLMARYGIREERLRTFVSPETGVELPGLLDVVPDLRVYTLDGTPIIFPAHDPDRLPYPVTNVGKKALNADVARQLQQQQAEIDALREQNAKIMRALDQITAPPATTE